MATKKLTETQKRLATLGNLFSAGFKTEKAISAMTFDSILNIDGMTIDEMKRISELQKALKEHRVISYLSGGDEDEQNG